jgi:hypothetical protein
MIFKNFILVIIHCLIAVVPKTVAFVPHNLVRNAIQTTNSLYGQTSFGYVSETLTHEEIIKRGIIRSVAKFFHEQPNGKKRIDLTILEKDYYHSIKRLYSDYYGMLFCKIPLENLIHNIFQKKVVHVDTDEETKDLPYAHFDAESFRLSNDRVIHYQEKIDRELKKKNYLKAAHISGLILHTIHDFYSHSNWVMLRKKIW